MGGSDQLDEGAVIRMNKYCRNRTAGKKLFSRGQRGAEDANLDSLRINSSLQNSNGLESSSKNKIDTQDLNGDPDQNPDSGVGPQKCEISILTTTTMSDKNMRSATKAGMISDSEYLKRGIKLLQMIPTEKVTIRSFEKCFMPKDRKPNFSDFL